MCKAGCTECDDCREKVERVLRKARIKRRLRPDGPAAAVRRPGRGEGDGKKNGG